MTESTIVFNNTYIQLQFKQPVATVTADLLKSSIEKHEKIAWEFTLKARYIIEETRDMGSFTHDPVHTEIPFWAK